MSWCLIPFYNDAENLLKIENCKTGSVFGANFRHETTLWSEIVARARSQSHYMNKSHGESFVWNRIWIFWLVLGQLALLLGQLGLLKMSEIKLKYATFEASFFYVFIGKTNEAIAFCTYCSVITKKLYVKHKGEKTIYLFC